MFPLELFDQDRGHPESTHAQRGGGVIQLKTYWLVWGEGGRRVSFKHRYT